MKRLFVAFKNKCFYYREMVLSLLSRKKHYKILFLNKPDWEKPIRNSFLRLTHQITFGEIETTNFADFDMVVPLTIKDLERLAENPNLCPNNLIPIPQKTVIATLNDKSLFIKALQNLGFSGFLPPSGNGLSFPYIVKKRFDEWGQNSYVVQNAEDEKKYAPFLNHPEYFKQTFIKGSTEIATHLLMKNKKMVTSLSIKFHFEDEYPIKGKSKILFQERCSCKHLRHFETILSALNFEGLCCFNYKEIGNTFYLFEINPRFGGSLSPYFFSFLRHLENELLN